MRLTRRRTAGLLAIGPVLAATGQALPLAGARAQGTAGAADPRLGERGAGKPDAPVKVLEFFSLTCSHCAAFHRDVWPQVKKELVDTGMVRMVWRDFPLDQLALFAAVLARSLPADRYEGFVSTLFSTQDRWAFTRGDPAAELAKLAALAGMTKAQFDAARGDEALARAILNGRLDAEREYQVQATPSFSFQSQGQSPGRVRNQSGGMPFEEFKRLVEEVRGA